MLGTNAHPAAFYLKTICVAERLELRSGDLKNRPWSESKAGAMTSAIEEVLDKIIQAATEAKRLAETPGAEVKPFAYSELLSNRLLQFNNALREEIAEGASLAYSKTGQFTITLPMPLTAEQVETVVRLWDEIMGKPTGSAASER